MKFVKSAFLSVVFACISFSLICRYGYSATCSRWEAVSALNFCEANTAYPCPAGCYCPGGTFATLNPLGTGADRCNDLSGTYSVGGANIGGGAYRCPSNFRESLEGNASEKEGCFKWCDNNHSSFLFYNTQTCDSGKYLKARDRTTCSDCPKGHYCRGISNAEPSCNADQGITGDCSEGNLYSLSGAAECSSCEEVGKAVVEQNGLNVNCQTCDAGKYANATHTDCDTCPVGYECPPRDENRPDDRPGGIAIRCGFDGDNENNQYQDEEGKTSCKTCTGTGKGVVVTTNDDNVRLHTGCTTCPDGTYPYNGICKTCEAGYYCKNGIRTICAKGTYAGTGQSSCAECARYYTTESTGSTSRNDCFLVRIKLKLNQEDTGISFPTCLLQGDINMTIVRRISS